MADAPNLLGSKKLVLRHDRNFFFNAFFDFSVTFEPKDEASCDNALFDGPIKHQNEEEEEQSEVDGAKQEKDLFVSQILKKKTVRCTGTKSKRDQHKCTKTTNKHS